MDKLAPLKFPLLDSLRVEYLESRLTELWLVVQEMQDMLMVPLKHAPKKIVEGTMRIADGVNWNPGAGAGIYEYRGGVWHKL
ncbi:MAG TPA: hypothetical protein VF077_00390 [Nitrospiraceae bacterium]